jgi:predicted MPP superfamily phosphohydrolase
MVGGSPAVEAMRRAARRAPADKPLLVIVHEPSFFHFLPPRPTLMIAGHTHGGQVRLPIIGSWSPDAYSALYPRGLFRRDGHTLLVSSGLGTSILPIRIGVPPEIVEVTLIPDQAGRNSGTDRYRSPVS